MRCAMKIGITGHRPKNLTWGYNENDDNCTKFKEVFGNLFLDLFYEPTYFICGMAMGIDLIAGEIVADIKQMMEEEEPDAPPIFLEAVIPCDNQTLNWNNEYVRRYNKLLKNCSKTTFISHQYNKFCMIKRNHYIVDNCDILIAVWNNEQSGGTAATIDYAKKVGRKIIYINPYTLKIDY